jgi:hypothetical protein
MFVRMAWIGVVFALLLVASTVVLAPVALLSRAGDSK